MPNEIGQHVEKTLTGTPYAIIRNNVNQVWDVTNNQFTAYNGANIGDYDIPMTQQGASDFWIASMPTHTNFVPGVYNIQVYDDAGGLAEGNPHLGSIVDLEWNGGVQVDPNLIHIDFAFNVDSPNTRDEYTVSFKINGFEVSPAQITGTPQINVKDRADADLITTINMTQVGTEARWIHNEVTDRVTLGEAYYAVISATIFGQARQFVEVFRRDK